MVRAHSVGVPIEGVGRRPGTAASEGTGDMGLLKTHCGLEVSFTARMPGGAAPGPSLDGRTDRRELGKYSPRAAQV